MTENITPDEIQNDATGVDLNGASNEEGVKHLDPGQALDALPDLWMRRELRAQLVKARTEAHEANARLEAITQEIRRALGVRVDSDPPAVLDRRDQILEITQASLQRATSVVQSVAVEPVAEAHERLAPAIEDLNNVIAPALEQVITKARATVTAAKNVLAEPAVDRLPALWNLRDRLRAGLGNISGTGTNAPGVIDTVPEMIKRVRKKFADLSPATVGADAPYITAEIKNLREHIHSVPKYEAALLAPLDELQTRVRQLKSEDVNTAVTAAPHAGAPRTERAISMVGDFR